MNSQEGDLRGATAPDGSVGGKSPKPDLRASAGRTGRKFRKGEKLFKRLMGKADKVERVQALDKRRFRSLAVYHAATFGPTLTYEPAELHLRGLIILTGFDRFVEGGLK